MTKEQRKSIIKDIERNIVHIARSNGVFIDEVKSILIDEYVDEDDFIIIQFPEIQAFMELEGFKENACLANDSIFVERYGSSAYFVSKKWLNSL